MEGGKKVTFLVMENVLQPERDIHVIYDLKGSKVGRTTRVEQRKPGFALKDLDFRRTIDIPRHLRERFMAQIRLDSEMLMHKHLNDYSLLIGIHTNPTPLPAEEVSTNPDGSYRPLFRRSYGGVPSRDRREVFYTGIIDVLTFYGVKKKAEHQYKSIWNKSYDVSCVPPEIYRERFVRFFESVFDVSSQATGAGAWARTERSSMEGSSLRRKLSSTLFGSGRSKVGGEESARKEDRARDESRTPRYIDPHSGYQVRQ